MTVLDAPALLALLFREAGHETVQEVFGAACISTVNVAEG
jgi:PIN domain nuclease of toxin-antitoxin system